MLGLRVAAACACVAATVVPSGRAPAGPAVTGRIDVSAPAALAVNPRTGLLYVAGLREVWVADLASERVEARIDVRGRPSDVAVSPATNKIYVSSTFRCSVDCWPRGLLTVVDGSSNEIVSEVRVGRSPVSVAVNRRTDHVFVANYNSENVSVVDGATNEVVSVVDPLLGYPVDLAVNPRTNGLYVTGTEKVAVVDPGDGSVVWSGRRAPGYDQQVEVDPRAGRVYLTHEAGGKIVVLDGSSHRVVRAIELPQDPAEVGLDPKRKRIYVTTRPPFESDEDGELVSIDAESYEILGRSAVSAAPWHVAVNAATGRAYVADDLADAVWVIAEEEPATSDGVATPARTMMRDGTRQGGATPTCDGRAATRVGTPRDDVIRGTRRRDVIVGLGGDDVIKGRGHRDAICGNRGADQLYGGNGIDAVVGGAGRDRLEEKYVGGGNSLDGGDDRDVLSYLTAGSVAVFLGAGYARRGCPPREICPDTFGEADVVTGIEIVFGSRFGDELVGDGRRNVLRGNRGGDALRGRDGDDRILGGRGRDTLNGGDGRDECRSGTRRRCET